MSFYKHNSKSTKNIDEAKKLKQKYEKIARKPDATKEDKTKSCEALRYYDYLQKEHKIKDESAQIKTQS